MAPFTKKNISLLTGYPVCIVLEDGRCYLGKIEKANKSDFILADIHAEGEISPHSRQSEKAQIASFLQPFLGGGGLNQLGSLMGNLGNQGTGEQATGGSAAGNTGTSGPQTGTPGTDGAAQGNANAGIEGQFGGLGKWWPHIRLGYNVLRYVFPMLSKFSI